MIPQDNNKKLKSMIKASNFQKSNDDDQIDQSINTQEEFEKYINEKKELYDNLILFLDNVEENEKDFENLIQKINQQYDDGKESFQDFFLLLKNIANNHYLNENIWQKLFKVINNHKDQIKQTLSNSEVFNIFESNKIILLFLFENKILTVDDEIYNELISKIEKNGNRYCHFFYPEIKEFVGDEKSKNIENELLSINSNIFDCFNEKRHEGQNDSYICNLIRHDSVKEFVSYVTQANIPLNSEVKKSIFETNLFLIENKNTTLIEYAAFFGSIQIFQFIKMNSTQLKPSLWLYTIHSHNADLIHLIESHDVEPPEFCEPKNQSQNQKIKFEKCLCESIKCHHNDFARYIEDNLMPVNIEARKREEVVSIFMQFTNFSYYPLEFGNLEFFYSCSYKYHKLVNLYMKKNEEKIKKMISVEIL